MQAGFVPRGAAAPRGATAPHGHASQPRCRAARAASSGAPAQRPELNALVVVEGTSDAAALRRAVDCAVAVTNGTPPKANTRDAYKLPPGVLRRLAAAARERDVIVFADPDSAGRAMRSAVAALASTLTHVRHAFIGHHLCRCASGSRAGDTGVEFAAADAIRAALAAAREQQPARQEFTRGDLEAWGLAGRLGETPPAGYQATGGVAERRNRVAAALGIGPCDGKTFLKYANEFGFTREEVVAALAALEDATPPGR